MFLLDKTFFSFETIITSLLIKSNDDLEGYIISIYPPDLYPLDFN